MKKNQKSLKKYFKKAIKLKKEKKLKKVGHLCK